MSSHKIKSTDLRTSMALKVMSAKLPIGVGTIINLDMLSTSSYRPSDPSIYNIKIVLFCAMGVKLSVVIITYNEEKNIERCLKSVQPIADEIIVVDSFSTDSTEAICKSYNVLMIMFSHYMQTKL